MANRMRKNPVQIYFSDEELELLNHRLEGLGVVNRSNYMRKMVLNGYCVQLDLPELRNAVALLGRCGNNLNQYAKMANATGSFYAKDIAELKSQFDQLCRMVQDLLAQIAKVQ